MNKINDNRLTRTVWNIAMTLGACAIIFTLLAIYQHQGVVTELHSTQGCCSIYVNHQGDEWTVIYQDNIAGTQHIEVETRQVDADAMVDIYQEHCYDTHYQE